MYIYIYVYIFEASPLRRHKPNNLLTFRKMCINKNARCTRSSSFLVALPYCNYCWSSRALQLYLRMASPAAVRALSSALLASFSFAAALSASTGHRSFSRSCVFSAALAVDSSCVFVRQQRGTTMVDAKRPRMRTTKGKRSISNSNM